MAEEENEEFARKMVDHGYTPIEQAIGVENSKNLEEFNALRLEDMRADVAKSNAEVELVKAHEAFHTQKTTTLRMVWCLLGLLAWIVFLTGIPAIYYVWNLVF